jgi:hypothetical protein
VSSFDDYEDEMARLRELSDRDLDRLFAAGGSTGSALSDDLEAVLGAARAALDEAPNEAARERHLAVVWVAARDLASAEQTRAPAPVPAPLSLWRKVMRRSLSVALKLSVALGAATLSMAGLAYAGVDLPGSAAENAVEKVLGVELPNQQRPENAGKSVADDVHAVIEGSDDRGCEFGQAVAAAASANRQDESPAKDDPCTRDDSTPNGSRATGEERSADGRARASEASGGASDAGADNAGTHDDFGRATAEEASNGGQGNGSASSDAGADNAGAHDDFGRSRAEEASSSGQENKGKANRPTDRGTP